MSKKRKSIASHIDEVDRTMYSSFSNAANSLSHLYSIALTNQKLSFLSGERHGLEKLYQWISKQDEEGLRVTSGDILAYIETIPRSPPIFHRSSTEAKCRASADVVVESAWRHNLPLDLHCHLFCATVAELDSSVDDPPIPPRISSQQNQQHTQITNPFINSSSSSMPQGFRPDQSDQPSKNYIFSNALSSPVRRSLQNYHISQEGYVVKNNDHQDSSMDMHADSTGHDSTH
ncbi:chlorophyll A/B binding protein domain-containing protein [Tanacetum coccineum]